MHSSVPHHTSFSSVPLLVRADLTFQLLQVALLGRGKIRVCNVYSAPGRRTSLAALRCVVPSIWETIPIAARHPDLGDSSPIPNRNGSRLLDDVRRYPLTRCWDIGILVVRPTPVEEVAWTTLYSPQDWWLHASSAPPSLCFFLAMLPLASATQFQLHPPSRYLPNTTQHTSPTWLLLCCFLHSTFTPLVYYISRWWNQAIYM